MTQPLDSMALAHFQLTAAVLFALGVVGFLSRRNLIIMFLCTEMMFHGVALSLLAFGRFHMNEVGQSFVIFLLSVAAAEAAPALGLVVLLFRRKRTLDVQAWTQLNG